MFKILKRTGPISQGDLLAYQIKTPLSTTWQTMATWKTSPNDVEVGNGPTWDAQPYPSSAPWFVRYFADACLQSGLSFPFVLTSYAHIFGTNNITHSSKTGYPFYLGRSNVLEQPVSAITSVFKNDSSASALPYSTFSAIADITKKKFGTASAKFTGLEKIALTGEIYEGGISKSSPSDWVDPSNRSAFDFSDDTPFTLECWVYIETVHPGTLSVATIQSSANNYHGIKLVLTDGVPRAIIGTRDYGWGLDISTKDPLTLNDWHHLALGRDGNNIFLFVDGKILASGVIDSDIIFDKKSLLSIGGGDEALEIVDQSGNNCAPSTGYSTTISTSVKRFGNRSAKFQYVPGKADVNFRKAGQFNLSSNDFTFDFWLYAEGTGVANIVGTGNATSAPSISLTSDNTLLVKFLAGLSNAELKSLATVAPQTWTHVAFVRNSENVYLFINGVKQDEKVIGKTTVIPSISDVLYLGSNTTVNTAWSNSFYLDDFRFSKSIARFTTNFAPGTAAVAADAQTTLLVNFEDASIYNFIGNIDELRVSVGINRYASNFSLSEAEFQSDRYTALLYHFNKNFDSEKSQIDTIIDAFAGTVIESASDIPQFRVYNVTTATVVGIVESIGGSDLGVSITSPDRKEAVVKCATTQALTGTYSDSDKSITYPSAGIVSIDGIVPVVGDLILVKDQINVYENGVYVVGKNSAAEQFTLIKQNKVVYPNWVEVTQGAAQAAKTYYQTSATSKSLPYSASIFQEVPANSDTIFKISDAATSRWRSGGAFGAEGSGGGGIGPTGPTGPQGPPNGPTGPTGPAGITGATGAAGLPGASIRLKGYVNRVEDLPTTGNQIGDCWIVQFASYDNYPYDIPEYEGSGHLWTWTGTEWIDAGRIVGPAGPPGPSGPTGPTGPSGGPPGEQGESGIVYRNSWEYTTPSMAVGEEYAFEIELGIAIIVYDLELSRPCTIVVYGTPTYDEPNPYTFVGVLSHLVDDGTTKLGDGTIIKTRQYSIFANLETPTPLPKVYAKIINNSPDSSPVTIKMTYFTALVEAQGRPPKDLEIVTAIPSTGTEGKLIYHRGHQTTYLRLDGEWKGISGLRQGPLYQSPLPFGFGSSITDVTYSGTSQGTTPLQLSLEPAAPPNLSRLILPQQSLSTLTIHLSGFCASTGEALSKIISVSIKTTSSGGAVVRSDEIVRDDGVSWTDIISVSSARELSILVNGEAAKTISWVASIRGSCTGQI